MGARGLGDKIDEIKVRLMQRREVNKGGGIGCRVSSSVGIHGTRSPALKKLEPEMDRWRISEEDLRFEAGFESDKMAPSLAFRHGAEMRVGGYVDGNHEPR